MSNALDHVRNNCGIAGEEVAEMVYALERQLAECERESESFHMDYRMKCDAETKVLHEQLATVTAERDELVAVLESIADVAARYSGQYPLQILTLTSEALAKVGADKTGEV